MASRLLRFAPLARRSTAVARGLTAPLRRHYATPSTPSSSSSIADTTIPVSWLAALVGVGGVAAYLFSTKDSDKAQPAKPAGDKATTSTSTTTKSTSDEEKKKQTPPPPPPPTITVPYVLIGGGTASHFAALGILSRKNDAEILIISEESQRPYQRPPLSKQLWLNRTEGDKFVDWEGQEKDVFYLGDNFYTPVTDDVKFGVGPNVYSIFDRKVVELNIGQRYMVLSDGRIVRFEKCLIATGGKPKNIDALANADEATKKKVILFRNLDDFHKLEKIVEKSKSIAVVGGGFLGSELAVALATKKKDTLKVTQIVADEGILGWVLPSYLSDWVTRKVREYGVDVRTNSRVSSASVSGKDVALTLSSGETVKAENVLVAVGIEPNTALAKSARLEVDPHLGGIVVNAELEARSGIFAAGDVCSFYDVTLGRRREEHHDHAVVSGRLAGENMAGAHKPYWHQSLFWSDIGDKVSFEAIGLVDSKLKTVSIWAKNTAETNTSAAASVAATEAAATSATPVDTKSLTETADATTTTPVIATTAAPVVEESKPADAAVNDTEYGKGVVLYLKDAEVVGVVAWNLPGKMPIARKLIRDRRTVSNAKDVAKLFNLYPKPEPLEDQAAAAADAAAPAESSPAVAEATTPTETKTQA